MDPLLLTSQQIRERYGLHRNTLLRWEKQGILHNRAKNGELERVVMEYEDHLARFVLEYIRHFLEAFGVELVVLNGKESEEVQRELAGDLVAIVSSFAARIYGKRGARALKGEREDGEGKEA